MKSPFISGRGEMDNSASIAAAAGVTGIGAAFLLKSVHGATQMLQKIGFFNKKTTAQTAIDCANGDCSPWDLLRLAKQGKESLETEDLGAANLALEHATGMTEAKRADVLSQVSAGLSVLSGLFGASALLAALVKTVKNDHLPVDVREFKKLIQMKKDGSLYEETKLMCRNISTKNTCMDNDSCHWYPHREEGKKCGPSPHIKTQKPLSPKAKTAGNAPKKRLPA